MVLILLVYSILAYKISSTHKILMDCGKYHMIHDVIIPLWTGISECQQYNHTLIYCLCVEQQS